MATGGRMRATLGRVWSWYAQKLESRPLLTQATTTGIICGAGDMIAQCGIEQRTLQQYKLKRTAVMFTIGFVFTGPVLRGWFYTLDRIFGPTRTAKDVAKKVVVDQVLFLPVLYMCLLPMFGVSQGLGQSQIREKVKKEYFNMLTSGYKVWPTVQAVNFYAIPLKFRVNFMNCIALGWNSYVAWLVHR